MKISYAITACNEHEELDKLLHHLLTYKRDKDEIIIQLDSTATDKVKMVTFGFKNHITKLNIFSLNNDFATFKNNLKEQCTGDYIFQIDADEIPNMFLIKALPELLETNPEIDILLVPRENYVNNITPEHIKQWGWKLDEQKRINWPDLQWRIYKNKPEIIWVNKIHERLDGFMSYTNLPIETEWSLNHTKDITRQEKQNNFYNTI
jgi:glycosyltransferase involved in cell wall biosynthesis